MAEGRAGEGRGGRNEQDREQTEHSEFPHRLQTQRILDEAAQNGRRQQTFRGINRERPKQEPERDMERESDEQSNRQHRDDQEPPAPRLGEQKGAKQNRIRKPEGSSARLAERHAVAIGEVKRRLEQTEPEQIPEQRPESDQPETNPRKPLIALQIFAGFVHLEEITRPGGAGESPG